MTKIAWGSRGPPLFEALEARACIVSDGKQGGCVRVYINMGVVGVGGRVLPHTEIIKRGGDV